MYIYIFSISLKYLVFSLNMSLTTPLIFQVHAVPESKALCWPASIEGQVLRAILSPKAFASVCKRLQTRLAQDSRFKIQDPKKTSWIPGLGSGEFLDSRSFFWILNPEPVQVLGPLGSFANVCKRFWWQNCSKYLGSTVRQQLIHTYVCIYIYIWYPPMELKLNRVICPKSVATSKTLFFLGVPYIYIYTCAYIYICIYVYIHIYIHIYNTHIYI